MWETRWKRRDFFLCGWLSVCPYMKVTTHTEQLREIGHSTRQTSTNCGNAVESAKEKIVVSFLLRTV